MRLIETTHLKMWAASKPAESRFPYFIKELICAVIQPEKIRFPSGDAVWIPGFDGVVVNSEKNIFVPTGLSVWEAGTGAKYKDKANKDYEKRSKDKVQEGAEENLPQKLDRSEISFVFATPLVWTNKEDWVAKRLEENIWHDVIVIDGVDFQDWLEVAPAVNLQFAAELGIVPELGLQTPEQAWQDWSFLTDLPASEEVVIVGREEQEKDLIGRLSSQPSVFTVRGDSPREALGFTLAALRRVGSEEKRQSFYARTIVADNEEIVSRLRYLRNHIILLKQAAGQVSGYLSSRGCHVIIPEGNDARSVRNVIILSRPSHRPFVEALGRMGFDNEEAERATRSCGLSVTILQRQCAHANFELPRWATGQNAANLLPALLASRWNNRNDADQQILCQLADVQNYSSFVEQLQEFLWVDERPLQKIEEMWALTAPVDAFQLIARRLTNSDLLRFKDAFREVFGRIDPKVEIPPDEWLYYDIKGAKGHSGWLRTGMAETLLLIAERGSDAGLICVQSPRDYVEEVVRGLPGLSDDWRILASLRDQYARLMEAAPRPLLDSLEGLLETKPQDISLLFTEDKGGFGGGAMHTGLLWGLETIAWIPDYLPQIALLLARLASLDTGGRLLNRPINSLYEIFLWWHPCTNAPIDRRLAALDLILSREPAVGWKLLAKLLPNATSSISHPTVKPRWKDFGDLPEDSGTGRGQLIYLSEIVDRSLEHVGSDPLRWQAVLESIRVISTEQQEKALANLNDIGKSEEIDNEKRLLLWGMLRDFVCSHRTFTDTHWALPSEIIERLEAILLQIAPDDPIENNRWLFDDWLPELPSGEKDIDHRQKAAEELRHKAVSEILKKKGVQGIIKLGISCKFPGWVASVSVPLMDNLDDVFKFIEEAIAAGDAGVKFAGQISGHAQQLYGAAWCEIVQKEIKAGKWSSVVAATLMLWWPDLKATWLDVEALGEEVKAEYWRRKQVPLIEGDPEDQEYIVEHLINSGRSAEALHRLALNVKGMPSDVMLQVFDATFDELKRAQTAEEILRLGLKSYDIRKFLDQLRKRSDIPREELARREYKALPLLGSLNIGGLTIHEFMANDPNFFIEIICDVYRPAHRDKSKDAELHPDENTRARTAYSLLKGMDFIPGQQKGNVIDEALLLAWIYAVRKRAVEVDRAAVTDLKIGDILSHALADPEDGGWPHLTVRNVIEKLAAQNIDRGLIIKRHNMRGIHCKALFEGGAQERELAKQYQEWAEISRTRWPRMARVLATIAKDYKEEARREDARAEQDKLE